jgi:L-cysteine/cystine lyase
MSTGRDAYRPLSRSAHAEIALARHRREFAALDEGIYANFGARGIMARSAIATVGETLEMLQAAGPASRIGQAVIARETLALRDTLAALLRVPQARVALVENVSQACAAALWGIDWRAGDQCLLGVREPPGTWIAARQLVARFGIALVPFDAGGADDIAGWRMRLSRALRPTTRLVLLSHVDWITGAAIPLVDLAEIVRAGPAPDAAVVVDGAQAVGALAVDLSNADIDLYAVAGQKWLGGPDGVAAMIVPGRDAGRIKPGLVGWRAAVASPNGDDIELARDAIRFETGTAAFALLPSLREAVQVADGFAPMEFREARITGSTAYLAKGLDDFAGHGLHLLHRGRHGIVSFTIDGISPVQVVRKLEDHGIIAKAHTYPGCTRLCVHYLNQQSEIDAMLEAIAEICGA